MIDQGRSFSGHERNCVFLNTGGPRFATVSAVSGLDYDDDGRAYAVVDWDGDGDLDLWTSNRNAPRLRLMRNDTASGNHFLALRLQGDGKSTSRDAIGARVELHAAGLKGRRLIRTLRAGEGLLAQSSKWVHFGLGTLTAIDKVTVRWPGGKTEEFTGLSPDGRYLLVQGTGKASQVPARSPKPTKLTPGDQEPVHLSGEMRIPLVTPLPMPPGASYLTFDGEPKPLIEAGRPTMVTLWASWCVPCRAEMKEFKERQEAIRAAGLDVVALAVDGLGEDGSTPEKAAAVARRLDFPFRSGRALPDFVQLMQGYHHFNVVLTLPLPIPTSFLVDANGRVSVIYKGPVRIDTLLKDARQPPGDLRERWLRAACLPGRTLDNERLLRSVALAEAKKCYTIAEAFAEAGHLEGAVAHYAQAVKLQPEFAAAHEKRAMALQKLRRDQEAIGHFREALKGYPKRARIHYNLGLLLHRKGEREEAVTHYQDAIQARSDYLEAHVNLGAVLMELKRYDEAARHFRRALEIDPDFAPARENLRLAEARKRADE